MSAASLSAAVLEAYEKNVAAFFISSSLIFCYDAAAGSEPLMRCFLVDFAHVHPLKPATKDHGVLRGLNELIGLWERAAEGPGVNSGADQSDDGFE